jgi:hypothetical protein
MANNKHQLIIKLDRASHELGVVLKERGVNNRILRLHFANTDWFMKPDGDKLLITASDPRSRARLWEDRIEVDAVIEVMKQVAGRRQLRRVRRALRFT